MSAIPKIIHQTWKSYKLPVNFIKWSKSWLILNFDYEYRFYNDKDCYRFIYENYPEFIDLYDDLTPVQKSDVFRYLVLHKHGGVYADMDTTCFRNLDSLLEQSNGKLITGIEYEGSEGNNIRPQLLQWFIASPPGHPALLNLVKEIQRRWWWRWSYSWVKSPNSLTYWLTGPEVFTEMVGGNSNVLIMPKGILGSYDPRRLTLESYLQHHFAGSWKNNWDVSRMR